MVTPGLSPILYVTLLVFTGVAGIPCPIRKLPVDTSSGFIESPRPDNVSLLDCKWVLEATRNEWSIKIEVLHSELDEGPSGGCQSSNKYVILREGSSMRKFGKFCGKETPTFYSTSRHVLIRFKTTYLLRTNQGFKLKYSAGVFGSIGDEIIQTTKLVAQDELQYFLQPWLEPYGLSTFVKRAWQIRNEHSDREMYVRVRSLSLADDGCAFNYIMVFSGEDRSGPSLGKWCHEDKPDDIVVEGTIYIVLHARDFNKDTKFRIEYGIHEKRVMPMIVGIFVGVIVFIGIVYVAGKLICWKFNNDDDTNDNNDNDIETAAGNQSLINDHSTSDEPPSFSELSPSYPTAPPADVITSPSAPPPSYEDVMRSPLSYDTAVQDPHSTQT